MTAKPAATASGSSLDRRQLLSALRALKRGELDVRMRDDLDGIDGQICDVFNELAQSVDGLVDEVGTLRVAVGTEGRIHRRLPRGALKGGWARVSADVNGILDDLTSHSDEMARVVTAVARGDLGQRIDLDGTDAPLKGAFLKHAKAVNDMADQLALFGSEVTRVAVEVGVDGKLGAEARIPGVSGAWKELTESVNLMASNLTDQVREIARVTTAVAQGDLTKTVDIEVKGEILALKNTINTMVGQLSSFADEVTRVAREVGTEGLLGGQARVRGVSGVWKDLTDNVNSMADNLTNQVRNIAEVSMAIAQGDLSRKITVEVKGEMSELKKTINTMVDQLSSFADEVTRVAREVGTEGVLGGQAAVPGARGVWRELTENVNSMADNLTSQVRNIAEVVGAIAEGDLSKKITVDARGEILALKNTTNTTVDKLNHVSAEVTRVARLVGTEGTLGVQAEVRGVSGVWRELTDNVNLMGRNLTDQVRDIAQVTTAVANGDLSKKITVEVQGEILALKNTINAMVDSLSSFADEVTRMAREVGTEGVLGGQAAVRGVSGIWKELTDNVNSMADNLTSQVRNISEVASAVASGDLTRRISVDARGEVLELKSTINGMVDQLERFAAEVTRVSREVGVEGNLGGQAAVEGVRGTWKELTDNVNLMANNLTDQVRDISEVTRAVAMGDLSRKITVSARGEILALKDTINTMVDQLSSFAEEVTRLATEVGVDGRLGGQADVRGVSGVWRDLTDAVNSMAGNLTDQVRSISDVARAIAEGNLRRKITVDAQGEILELRDTINTMVDQLSSFAEEVARVAREVGIEGKLGGKAEVAGVRGIWKELTDNVNVMADNLTAQVRDIARVATAIAEGDLSRKITVEVHGEILQLKETINRMVDQLSSFAVEVTRVARAVGVEGKLGGQAEVRGVSGTWRELTDNVNLMASNLTDQVRDIAGVTTAVAKGDLSRKITVEVQGEFLQLKETINTMVDQLRSFANEVTRVAREVGTDGVLGGQAQVLGVSGTWRELTDSVNQMASNLTEQVRAIARVVTAVANGDLKQELHLDARGEIATLEQTINDMLVTLSTFADQVTSVAHDVGVEGKLGGQADVPGSSGIWLDLTNNVNELAGNLTRQVRAIGSVATAVTRGDLTQTIDVEARGEVALLKDNLNQMIRTLAETTRINQEQDWLKTSLARFTRMLQGQRDLVTVARQVLSELASTIDAQHGAFYMARLRDGTVRLELFASYAYVERKTVSNTYRLGEGLVGQSALERKRILITNVPVDYIQIESGLGGAVPTNIVVCPVLFESDMKGVIELASFRPFSKTQLAFLDQLIESLGIVVATIEATMRTDELLRESQRMAEELQHGQEELQHTNAELQMKARELTQQRDEVEVKNREVERARQELEAQAEKLALTSRYKSQFLANMSHELRTPLNSMLILSEQLSLNREQNLTGRQIEYARTIHQAGADLLVLINEVLDLAKIESGKMGIELGIVAVAALVAEVDRTFASLAEQRGLRWRTEIEPQAPERMVTDEMRIKQVLRNLVSNAVKFTEVGEVVLRVRLVTQGEVAFRRSSLRDAEEVVAFDVRDTGIGIPRDKHDLVFEAFQQAEGGTSRKYGGTGLGLSISREIADLLGGELHLQSEPGVGSVFTLFLPPTHQARRSELRPRITAPPVSRIAAPQRMELTATGEPSTPDDDRNALNPGDRVLLAVEDEPAFSQLLVQVGRERGFRVLVAQTGEEALTLARAVHPDAITLDLVLPDMDGWVLLDRLKRDPATRHIPVQILSSVADERRGRGAGALATVAKPASRNDVIEAVGQVEAFLQRRLRRLLVVEDDPHQRTAIVALVGSGDIETVAVSTAEEAMEALQQGLHFDCMIVDLSLPDRGGLELIREVRGAEALRRVPIVVYTGLHLDRDQAQTLRDIAETVILKDVGSPEQLLQQTSLFLHRVESSLPDESQQMLAQLGRSDPALAGKRVLVVDDDVRNVFALTALLEHHRMEVDYAETGRQALERLGNGGGPFDVILMDIMMPEMDGYETMQRLRDDSRFSDLPIIALTAKAMMGDRERVLAAGASDYVTKPVDTAHLVSLLRVWLTRELPAVPSD
jgi:HAMP domain-containing protein/CheY-like chemotaxis protein/signal transduction histidine kinase